MEPQNEKAMALGFANDFIFARLSDLRSLTPGNLGTDWTFSTFSLHELPFRTVRLRLDFSLSCRFSSF
jgi:hypothetical protein